MLDIDWAAITPWIVAVSIAMFVGSLVILPLLLVSIPADYFVHRGPRFGWLREQHPVVRISLMIVKNVAGLALVIAGIVMLVTPGQGVLSILIGVCLMDFPGKRRLERTMLRQRGVLNTINAIRDKAGKLPLERPDGMDQSDEASV